MKDVVHRAAKLAVKTRHRRLCAANLPVAALKIPGVRVGQPVTTVPLPRRPFRRPRPTLQRGHHGANGPRVTPLRRALRHRGGRLCFFNAVLAVPVAVPERERESLQVPVVIRQPHRDPLRITHRLVIALLILPVRPRRLLRGRQPAPDVRRVVRHVFPLHQTAGHVPPVHPAHVQPPVRDVPVQRRVGLGVEVADQHRVRLDAATPGGPPHRLHPLDEHPELPELAIAAPRVEQQVDASNHNRRGGGVVRAMTYGYQAGHRGGVLAEVKVGKVNRFEPFASKRVAPVEKGAPVGPPAGAWRV